MECVTFVNRLWSPWNNFTSPDPITLMAIEVQPFLIVNEDRYNENKTSTYSVLCGPIMTLMCQFALKIKTSLKLQPTVRQWKDIAYLLDNDPPHFLLRYADINVFNFYKMKTKELTKVDHFISSNVIDYQALSHIAYKIYPGKEQMFVYFQYMPLNMVMLIILSMAIISITLLIIQDRLGLLNFVRYFFNLLRVFISCFDQKAISKSSLSMKIMLLLGPWIISGFLIGIEFDNLLIDTMAMAIPNQVIDSWEDLQRENNIKIISEDIEFLAQYSENSQSSIALNFKKRLQIFRLQNLVNMTLLQSMADDLLSGRAAYVKNKITIVFHMLGLQQQCNLGNKLLDTLHLSKYGGPQDQYFLLMPSTIPTHLADSFNYYIDQVRESGLYAKWQSYLHRSSKTFRFSDELAPISLFDYNDLSLTNVKDTCILWIMGILLSLLIFSAENYKFANIELKLFFQKLKQNA